MTSDRPVYGLTVLCYADGRTEVTTALDRCPSGISIESCDALPMPSSWRLRHAMLIDALAEVKREAGVEPSSNPGQLAEREGEG